MGCSGQAGQVGNLVLYGDLLLLSARGKRECFNDFDHSGLPCESYR